MNPTHAPGSLVKRLKWFCWKIQFCGDISEISDSALTNTVRSRTPRRLPLSGVIKLNLKKLKIDYHCGESDSALTNTVRNRTPRRLTLRGVKQILFAFKYLHCSRESRVHMLIFQIIFVNPKLTNTVRSKTPRWLTMNRSRPPRWLTRRTPRWLTLRGVLPSHILSLQASSRLDRED